jgi:hypothetical protein
MKRLPVLLAAGAAALALISTASSQPAPAPLEGPLAVGDVVGAGRAYEAALKASPSDLSAQTGMAQVRLFENRNDEAIALAQKVLAAKPDAPAAKQILAVAQVRKARFGPDRYQMAAPPSAEVTIPFTATDPLPVVQVAVGGRPASFLIDTGAPDLSVSADLAQALGLQAESVGEGVFAGGVRAPIQRTLVPQFELGGIRIANIPANIARQRPPVPGQIDGILGTGVFMHFLTTLDYCQGRLVLRPRSAAAEFERAAAKAGANIVPMWLNGDHIMMARARLLHGAEGMFVVDTGLAGGGLMATKAVLDEAGVAIDPNRVGTGMGGGGPVSIIPFRAGATLGAMTVDDVQGFYSPSGNPFDNGPVKVSGVLSHGFFRHSRLTFDFDAMKLITEAC